MRLSFYGHGRWCPCVPERRILLYVMAMAGGVILAAAWPDAGVLTMLAAASAGMLSGVIALLWGSASACPVPAGGEPVARPQICRCRYDRCLWRHLMACVLAGLARDRLQCRTGGGRNPACRDNGAGGLGELVAAARIGRAACRAGLPGGTAGRLLVMQRGKGHFADLPLAPPRAPVLARQWLRSDFVCVVSCRRAGAGSLRC